MKVPAVKPYFWVVKLLTTAMGEAVSDYLVNDVNKYLAVVVGFVLFALAITWQFRTPTYRTWPYWSAVAMVAVFGTMCADVMHIVLGLPYTVSATFYAVCLIVTFVTWYRSEGTLDIHSIVTRRREVFYWLAVIFTFAMGTALGDLLATTFHLGYLGSAFVFTGADLRAVHRVAAWRQPCADVLGGVHPDAADRRVVRGLLRDAEGHQRHGAGARRRVGRDADPGRGVLHLHVALRHRPAGDGVARRAARPAAIRTTAVRAAAVRAAAVRQTRGTGSHSTAQPQYGQPQYADPRYGGPQYGDPRQGQQQYGQPQNHPGQGQQPQYGNPRYTDPRQQGDPRYPDQWHGNQR